MAADMAVLKAVCLASGAALHIAPIPTMREIRAARSTLNFHIAPYASTLLNHSVNLWYAYIRGDGPLMIHRVAGICAQSYYLTTYLTFCPPAKAADNRKWLTWVFGILAGIFVWLHVLLPLSGYAHAYFSNIALFGAITGVGLAASPLATVREVLRNKDASSLPPLLCTMVTVQCFSWGVYGWLRDDWSTFANNAVGVVLGSIQLTLIGLYGNKRAQNGAAAAAPAGAVAGKVADDDDGSGSAGSVAPDADEDVADTAPLRGSGRSASDVELASSVHAESKHR